MDHSEFELRLCGRMGSVKPDCIQTETAMKICGVAGESKYKLLSPAKLPISRSACITIPSGYSPTAFLESPVLLSNVKAEPSPTTGTLTEPQLMHEHFDTGSCAATTDSSDASGERDNYEFKPRDRPATMVSGDLNLLKSEPCEQAQGLYKSESFAPQHLFRREMDGSPSCLGLPAPAHRVVASGVNPAGEVQALQHDHRGGDGCLGPSDDGYNWRKYGQKHVKGSEFPRSYYKCTHPNCEVKKLFERSHDGKIMDIIYKGAHDHPKPHFNRRCTASTVLSSQEERSERGSPSPGEDKSASVHAQVTQATELNDNPEMSPAAACDDSVDCAEDDDDSSKKRKMEGGGVEIVAAVVKPIREPRVVVQTVSEVDILDDGYKWRKYGQKVVRCNPNPRSYYKCTHPGCSVRKHVERASHDPKAVITTYEGKHVHEVPVVRTHARATTGLAATHGLLRTTPAIQSIVSLDLGVGVTTTSSSSSSSSTVENGSDGHASARSYFGLAHSCYYFNHAPTGGGGADRKLSANLVDVLPLGLARSPPLYSHNMDSLLMGP